MAISYGTDEAEKIRGLSLGDVGRGHGGADRIRGDGPSDKLVGGAGNNTL